MDIVTGLWLQRTLQTVRAHFDMDVASIPEFVGDRRIFRHVDADRAPSSIDAGSSMPLDIGYCKHVVDDRLPELISDTAALPAAAANPAPMRCRSAHT